MFNELHIASPLTANVTLRASLSHADPPRHRTAHTAAWFCCLVLALACRATRAEVPPYVWQSVPITGTNNLVLAAVEFDDGTGPALYIAGDFTTAGTTSTIRVARWDGLQWSSLGAGLNGQVTSLAVFTPAGGTASLYAGGAFTGNLARWNGQQWVRVGTTGLTGGTVTVSALTVFDDDGSGPNPPYLLIGGTFLYADGQPATNVAKWNGTTLSPGPSYTGTIQTLQPFTPNGASCASLFLGSTTRLTRLSGTSWSNYTWSNTNLTTSSVRSLCQYAPGGAASPLLVCGGNFPESAAPRRPGKPHRRL